MTLPIGYFGGSPVFELSALDSKDYIIDWSAWLAERGNDTITGATVTAVGMLTIGANSFTTTKVTFFVSSVIPGTLQAVQVRITTAGARTDTRTAYFWVSQAGVGVSANTTDLSRAYARLMPYAKGCPDVTLLFHLQQASIEFFQRTLAWSVDLWPVKTAIGQSNYYIPTPRDTQIVKLLSYAIDDGFGNEIGGQVVDVESGKDFRLDNSSAYVAWTEDLLSFETAPVPAVNGQQMTLRVALKPSQDSTVIPSSLFEQYIQHISIGALAGIFDIPNHAFSDANKADQYRAMFNSGIRVVGVRAAKAYGRSQQRSKSLYF